MERFEGNDPLSRLVLAIDVEGDAQAPEGGFGSLLPAVELYARRFRNPFGERLEAAAGVFGPACPPQFVETPVPP